MRNPSASFIAVVVCLALISSVSLADEWKSGIPWEEPTVVAPGPVCGPPADAIALFDGENLTEHWNNAEKWVLEDGVATSSGSGIQTKQGFGSCQLHLEFRMPEDDNGTGQGRGNSGVYFMGRYEVQILDSYENETYYDGQCGSIYKQSPPLVNANRKPGEWQTYDIIFTAPEFAKDTLVSPAYLTVLHNGVLVQNHFELLGGTFWDQSPTYEPHASQAPLNLQFHGDKVAYRNIWIRPLSPRIIPEPEVVVDTEVVDEAE